MQYSGGKRDVTQNTGGTGGKFMEATDRIEAEN